MKNRIRIFMGILCFICFIFSCIAILYMTKDYGTADIAYNEMANAATLEEVKPIETPKPNKDIPINIEDIENTEKPIEEMEEVIEEQETFKTLNVDYSNLPDSVIGWICIDGNDIINYPVVQSFDNNYYLNHLPDGTSNKGGSIFVDYRNDGLENRHIIMYGHNMKNSSMFSTIKKYRDKEYFDTHKYIYVGTKNGETRIFEVFSVFLTDARGESKYNAYQISFNSDDWKEWLNTTKNKSEVFSDIEIDEKCVILTLSTCMSRGDEYERCVVHAIEINNEQ